MGFGVWRLGLECRVGGLGCRSAYGKRIHMVLHSGGGNVSRIQDLGG